MVRWFKIHIRPWINIDNFQWLFGCTCLFLLPIQIAWIPFVMFWINVAMRGFNDRKNRIHDLAVDRFRAEETKEKAALEAKTVRDKEVIMENMKRLADEINSLNQRVSFIAPLNPGATGPTFVKPSTSAIGTK